jgi:DNA replication protein DnaC
MKYADLILLLNELRLYAIAAQLHEIARQAEAENLTYEQFTARIIEAEFSSRRDKRISRLLKESKIPENKSIENYDFTRVTGVTITAVKRLAEGDWLKKGENIVLYGSFGVGKTHLAAGLSQALCERGFRCLFITVNRLLEDLLRAKESLNLSQTFKRYDRYDLIACDELGYVPTSQDAADLFFQLIAHRYERRSILITTNLAYSEWHKVFINQTTTSAVVDRIIHHCQTFNIMGKSKRREEAMRASKEQNREEEADKDSPGKRP